MTYGNGLWVAVANTYAGGTNGVMYSTDGINWTSATTPSGSWKAVTYGAGRFVAVGVEPTGQPYDLANIMHSQNGINWTTASAGGNVTEDVVYADK